MKQLKIHCKPNKHAKIVEEMNKEGLTLQDYMTMKALEILNTNIEVSEPSKEIRPSFQFRLDATIYKLIEQKAKKVNKSITELFNEVLEIEE